MYIITGAVVTGLFFLALFLSGAWLSRRGRPLNLALPTLHKLVSLAAGIYLLISIYQRNRMEGLGGMEWFAIALTGLPFLTTVASRGFPGSEKPLPFAVLRAHPIAPVLARS